MYLVITVLISYQMFSFLLRAKVLKFNPMYSPADILTENRVICIVELKSMCVPAGSLDTKQILYTYNNGSKHIKC